jgi:hypothetical protein
MDGDPPKGTARVDLRDFDNSHDAPPQDPPEPSANSESESESEHFVRIQVSSDTEPHPPDQSQESPEQAGEVEPVPDDAHFFQEKFQDFMHQRRELHITVDSQNVDLLPAPLRPMINQIITKIKRWAGRGPTGLALEALQLLVHELNEYLLLQNRREDPDYEQRCLWLLRRVHACTLDTEKIARKLKDAAAPRALDEY